MSTRRSISGSESVRDIEKLCFAEDRPDELFLSRDALLSIINRFLARELTETELESIAEAMDANDLVRVDEKHTKRIADALFELSSSEINGPLTVERVASIRDSLLS